MLPPRVRVLPLTVGLPDCRPPPLNACSPAFAELVASMYKLQSQLGADKRALPRRAASFRMAPALNLSGKLEASCASPAFVPTGHQQLHQTLNPALTDLVAAVVKLQEAPGHPTSSVLSSSFKHGASLRQAPVSKAHQF